MPTNLPDFSEYGYRAEALLGSNPEGGRTAYRAVELATGRAVVIKRFSFAGQGASWQGYAAHEREIATLRELDHPRIPAFVADFETPDGFCLVQAFCEAPPMSARRSWSIEAVVSVARSALEVLDALQARVPSVIHRDLKPENILVDDDDQAHLVDFGLARADRADNTTIAAGTPGFMPPEQFFGREVTTATDLYGLGASLICALTGTPSHQVASLVDDAFRFDLSRLPRHLSTDLRRWLGRLVAPSLDASDPSRRRFTSAAEALEALERAARPRPARRASNRRPTTTPPSDDEISARRAASRARQRKKEQDAQRRERLKNLALVLIALAISGAVIGWVLSDKAPPGSYGGGGASRSDGTASRAGDTPVLCSSPGITVTRNVQVGPNATAVTARRGCELSIEGVALRGQIGVVVEAGAVVRMSQVSLDASATAVSVEPGGRLEIRDSSLSGAEFAVRVTGGTLTLHDTSVRATKTTGVVVDGDGELTLVSSTVEAPSIALSLLAGQATVETSELSAERAVVARAGRLTFERTTLDGGLVATGPAVWTGLDDDDLELGEAAADSWPTWLCQPLVACVDADERLGPVAVVATGQVEAKGRLTGIDLLQSNIADPVATCIRDQLTGHTAPAWDGTPRALRCALTGEVDADGKLVATTSFAVQ